MTTSTTQSGTEKWTNPLRNPRDMRLPRIAGPCSLVIFGVTGDLSKKKLIPAVYDLANRVLLPARAQEQESVGFLSARCRGGC